MAGVEDRVAVVTGAANGLGREIARVLAREGARVALGDLDAAGVERTAAEINARAAGTGVPDGAAFAVAGDLTEEGPAARLIEAAVARWGRLDILVNNVGGARNAKIWEMRAEDWDFVLRAEPPQHLPLHARGGAPHDAAALRAHRVHVLGAREGTPWTAYYQGGAAYSASKAGVHGFVRDVALELAEHGVNVNAVAPGPIDTERAGPSLKKLDETVEFSPSRMTPLHRIGQPIEVAHAVLFLCSDEASYITGHTLAVAGGR
jgi:3-oxoacyl-[acyl-carrier protein] reductase